MIEVVTFMDVKAAWDEFNSLPKPWCGRDCIGGSLPHVYAARDDAWQNYAKLRDHYLYRIKVISLTELNSKWYPRINGYHKSQDLQ